MKQQNPTVGLSDDEIVEGLRSRDPQTTRQYFYDTCRMAYYVYNRRYDLDRKPGLDFYSIAHEYYLALDKHDFKQLEDRRPGLTLRTWMVNGFRFILLDRLKAYNRERMVEPFEERIGKADVAFDIPDDNFVADFRSTVEDMCREFLSRDSRAAIILNMLLVEGFKGKEVAAQLGMTPSAVSQQFNRLMKTLVVPYFKANYVAPAPQASLQYDESVSIQKSNHLMVEADMCSPLGKFEQPWYSGRITPDHISALRPGEVFVFGSNLAGLHGGGAARMARLHFGAKMMVGVGPQGNSYAIPTMQGGVDTIRPYVDEFIDYARKHLDQVFLVTRIGCGIAGFEPSDIAPLFVRAMNVSNIHLPQEFWDIANVSGFSDFII